MRYVLLLVGLLVASSSQALSFDNLIGVSVGLGHATSDVGSGVNAEVGGVLIFANGSVSHKQMGDKSVTGAGIGLGLGPLFQLQVGQSNKGAFLKAKSEVSPYYYCCKSGNSDKGYQRKTGVDEPLKERLMINVGYEVYKDDSAYNNFNIGLGYVF